MTGSAIASGVRLVVLDWSDLTWGENMDAVLEERVATRSDPYLAGVGPPEFSTCLDLMPIFRMVWDVNGYYRELGIEPTATRRQIREAYQRKKGWLSHRLTFIMTQLLDSEVRSRYDSTPIGSMFLDEYVETYLRAQMAREVGKQRSDGSMSEDEFWGLDLDPLDFFATPSKSANVSGEGDRVRDHWRWGYYLWGSAGGDLEWLREWQHLLIQVLGERKEHHQLAIGFMGRTPVPYEVRRVGYRKVVFLNDRVRPTEVLAESASRVLANI